MNTSIVGYVFTSIVGYVFTSIVGYVSTSIVGYVPTSIVGQFCTLKKEVAFKPPPIYAQPLSPLDATPSTKYFWSARNTAMTGIMVTTLPAMIRPYSDEYCPMKLLRPS